MGPIFTKFGRHIDFDMPEVTACSKFHFLKIQDGRRPPSWISENRCHFAVDRDIDFKFGTHITLGHPEVGHVTKIHFRSKSKMADAIVYKPEMAQFLSPFGSDLQCKGFSHTPETAKINCKSFKN